MFSGKRRGRRLIGFSSGGGKSAECRGVVRRTEDGWAVERSWRGVGAVRRKKNAEWGSRCFDAVGRLTLRQSQGEAFRKGGADTAERRASVPPRIPGRGPHCGG